MSGGGGSDNSGMYYAQAQQAQAQIKAQQMANEFAAQQAQQQHQWSLDAASAADAKAAKDKQDAITQFQNDLGTATAGARNYAGQQEGSMGITGNDYGLMQNFNNLLNSTLSGIGSQQTGNAGALINGSALFDQANASTLSGQRNKLMQQYNQLFGNNYVNNAIGDDFFGSQANDLLASQQSDAKAAIDRAHARGQLNDDGYANALQQLNTQAGTARGQFNTAGQTVLDKYRQQLTDSLSGQKTALQNWTYGDTTDLGQFGSQITGMINKDKANASTDYLNAIGGQTYFDPTTILAKAGTYQGATSGTGAATGALSGAASNASTPLATKPVAGNTLANQGIV